MNNRMIGTVICVKDGYGFLVTGAGDAYFQRSDLPPDFPFVESLGLQFDFILESVNGKLRARDLYEHVGETFTGSVRIPPGKEFGFIRQPSGDEVFFHRNQVRGDFDSIRGKTVSFRMQETPRGMAAVCVEVAE